MSYSRASISFTRRNPQKDLTVGGNIFQLFLLHCQEHLLVGLETTEAKASKYFPEIYMHRLLNESKKNLTKEITELRLCIQHTIWGLLVSKQKGYQG